MTATDELRAWCETELDTSTFDGMRGAPQRVLAKAEELGIDVTVRWEQRELPHPSGALTGGGIGQHLVIEPVENV